MASSRSVLAILALGALLSLTSCGSGQARIGLRNAIVAAQVLQENPDPAVQSAARAIEAQVAASADQFDEVLWGLWTNRSKPTIKAQDWQDSAASASRRSDEQAEATRQETLENKAIQTSAVGLLGSLGLPLGVVGGSGMLAGLLSLLKNRQALKTALSTAISFGREVAPATTPEAVQAVKEKYRKLADPLLKAEVAKHKLLAKVP